MKTGKAILALLLWSIIQGYSVTAMAKSDLLDGIVPKDNFDLRNIGRQIDKISPREYSCKTALCTHAHCKPLSRVHAEFVQVRFLLDELSDDLFDFVNILSKHQTVLLQTSIDSSQSKANLEWAQAVQDSLTSFAKWMYDLAEFGDFLNRYSESEDKFQAALQKYAEDGDKMIVALETQYKIVTHFRKFWDRARAVQKRGVSINPEVQNYLKALEAISSSEKTVSNLRQFIKEAKNFGSMDRKQRGKFIQAAAKPVFRIWKKIIEVDRAQRNARLKDIISNIEKENEKISDIFSDISLVRDRINKSLDLRTRLSDFTDALGICLETKIVCPIEKVARSISIGKRGKITTSDRVRQINAELERSIELIRIHYNKSEFFNERKVESTIIPRPRQASEGAIIELEYYLSLCMKRNGYFAFLDGKEIAEPRQKETEYFSRSYQGDRYQYVNGKVSVTLPPHPNKAVDTAGFKAANPSRLPMIYLFDKRTKLPFPIPPAVIISVPK